MQRSPEIPRVAVTVAAAALVLVAGACAGSAPSPTTQSQTTAPSGGLPGAVDKADRTKDEVNERTRDLQEQVDSIGR